MDVSLSEKGLRGAAAFRCAGLTYRMGDHYARLRVVKPSMPHPTRRGRRIYSFRDVLALRIAADLRDAGLALDGIRRVAGEMRRQGRSEDWSPEARIMVRGDEVRFLRDNAELVDAVLAMPGGQGWCTIVEVGRFVREVKESFARARGVTR